MQSLLSFDHFSRLFRSPPKKQRVILLMDDETCPGCHGDIVHGDGYDICVDGCGFVAIVPKAVSK